jgi:hypothetical protein
MPASAVTRPPASQGPLQQGGWSVPAAQRVVGASPRTSAATGGGAAAAGCSPLGRGCSAALAGIVLAWHLRGPAASHELAAFAPSSPAALVAMQLVGAARTGIWWVRQRAADARSAFAPAPVYRRWRGSSALGLSGRKRRWAAGCWLLGLQVELLLQAAGVVAAGWPDLRGQSRLMQMHMRHQSDCQRSKKTYHPLLLLISLRLWHGARARGRQSTR